MERTIHTKFYTFSQNNSGGYFVQSDEHGICEYVIIEAQNAKEAKDILFQVGEMVDGFDDYCSCCGERWSTWIDDEDGEEYPSIYGKPVAECKKGMLRYRCFIHAYDGTITEHIFSSTNP